MKTPRNILTTVISLSIISCIALVSCQKDRIEEDNPPPEKDYQDPDTYMDSKKQKEQEFEITEDGTGPVTGNQGTNIWIGKSCLMFPSGVDVEYPYTIKLVELYTPKDMIYYQMPTIAGGKIMETEGEVRIRVFKDDTELSLKKDCYYDVEMPSAEPKIYMTVHYGFENTGINDWTNDPSSLGVTSTLNPVFDTTTIGHKASIAILGWINCGSQIGNGNGNTISYTSSTDDLSNVAIFCYLPRTKTVMQVYDQKSGALPGSEIVKTVAFAQNSSDVLFSHDDEFTLVGNMALDITLDETNDAALTILLDAL